MIDSLSIHLPEMRQENAFLSYVLLEGYAIILFETSDVKQCQRTSCWLVEETRTVVGRHGAVRVKVEKSVVNGMDTDSRRRTVKSE